MLGVAMGLGLDTVTSKNTMLALLPIGAMSWFAQNFLVLYLLTPLINRVLHWLQHKYYVMLLAISTVIWFVIPTALNLWPGLPHTTFGFKHIFLKAKIAYHPWINTIASTTFGIYLLHDNKLFLHHMWDNIFGTYQYYDSALLPLYAILMVALIFIVGMVVEYMRLAFIEKPIMKRITLYIDSSQSWMEKKVPF